jgi:hypothetical protein
MIMRSFSEFLSSGHERLASRFPADAARITAGSRRGPESRIFAQVSPGATVYPGLRDLAAASGIAATALSLFRFDVTEKGCRFLI